MRQNEDLLFLFTKIIFDPAENEASKDIFWYVDMSFIFTPSKDSIFTEPPRPLPSSMICSSAGSGLGSKGYDSFPGLVDSLPQQIHLTVRMSVAWTITFFFFFTMTELGPTISITGVTILVRITSTLILGGGGQWLVVTKKREYRIWGQVRSQWWY